MAARSRVATPADLAAMVAIYNHHVVHGYATFDDRPYEVDEKQPWFGDFATDGPHRLLVAVDDHDRVLGFAGTAPYRDHRAFAATVAMCIYLAAGAEGRGIGTALYQHLFRLIDGQGLHRAVAGIALPNEASVRLHRRFGFTDVGTFDEYATKGGRRLSSLWMQKAL